jgi:plasmid stabilization system protein ParE
MSFEVEITRFALNDLEEARDFYRQQGVELGDYFLDALLTDIESLALYGGIHPRVDRLYRLLSRRFPYGIYYRIVGKKVEVIAVLDLRRNPSENAKRLRGRGEAAR